MRHIYLFIVICCLFGGGELAAQQLAQYSLYMMNKHHVNPAYAGLDHSVVATGVFRKQWVDLVGSPTSQQLSVHMPVYRLGGGLGLNVENDVLGAKRTTSASLSYSYWMALSKKSLFAIGVGAGIMQKALDGNKLRAPEGTYGPDGGGLFNHNDNSLPTGLETAFVPIVNAGIHFQNENWNISLAAKNLLESEANIQLEQGSTQLKQNRHFYGMIGFGMDIGSTFELMPSLLLQSDLQETQIELNARIRYNGNIFGGAGIRGYNKNTLDAVVFIVGLNLNEKTTLAYAYDLTLSGLNAVSNGSHEITIIYNLNKTFGGGVPPPIIHNPRFL